MKTRTIVVTAALGAALATATLLQALSASGGGPVAPAVARSRAAAHVAAEGRVAAYPGAQARVAAERPGRLLRVLVEEAQPVKRGQLLAELEPSELAAALDEARARLAEAEAERTLAAASLERHERLADEGVVSAHDLDRARRDLDTASARRENARAAVSRLEAALAKTRILAPISGTVLTRHAEPGETLDAGAPVVTIADLGRLRVEAEADEADAGALAPGATVVVTAEGWPGRAFSGRVEELGASVTLRRVRPQDPGRATDTRVLPVKVAFTEPTPLKLGTTVELRIATR